MIILENGKRTRKMASEDMKLMRESGNSNKSLESHREPPVMALFNII